MFRSRSREQSPGAPGQEQEPAPKKSLWRRSLDNFKSKTEAIVEYFQTPSDQEVQDILQKRIDESQDIAIDKAMLSPEDRQKEAEESPSEVVDQKEQLQKKIEKNHPLEHAKYLFKSAVEVFKKAEVLKSKNDPRSLGALKVAKSRLEEVKEFRLEKGLFMDEADPEKSPEIVEINKSIVKLDSYIKSETAYQEKQIDKSPEIEVSKSLDEKNQTEKALEKVERLQVLKSQYEDYAKKRINFLKKNPTSSQKPRLLEEVKMANLKIEKYNEAIVIEEELPERELEMKFEKEVLGPLRERQARDLEDTLGVVEILMNNSQTAEPAFEAAEEFARSA